ncbi:hypothetical protein N7G274_004536 [Stereocaulon virgatum]|uniref:Uncharacterized protein n=1 Tax=Stereocaulon virgatum TaxID=373712 RepID=A0ABR4AA73_9LECA
MPNTERRDWTIPGVVRIRQYNIYDVPSNITQVDGAFIDAKPSQRKTKVIVRIVSSYGIKAQTRMAGLRASITATDRLTYVRFGVVLEVTGGCSGRSSHWTVCVGYFRAM